ncbi:MAG: iron ABC transporter permease [Ndongobacter sp.]|nr:iron ABC transporter permease [Ndongobacter sp.]
MSRQRKKRKRELAFFLVSVLLLVLFVVSVNVGSLRVSIGQLLRGLFLEYDETVATIYDLRFPRVLLSMLAGAAISVSGVLFQAILKNPLADPGIIGISGGASFAAVLIIGVAPTLYFFTPVFAFLGGLGAFCIVYGLSWRGGLSPLRIILVGVAVSAMFSGLSGAFNYMTGSALSGVSSLVNGNITMKTWDDVHMMLPYVLVGLILSMLSARTCNLLSLGDRTVRGLGINVQIMRLYLSLIAVLLASISTALVGAISFLGLIVPHIGRLLMGTDHRRLLPFSMLLGAFVFLLADTLGRTVAAPYEIPAGILMSVIGGPFFVILLRRSKKYARS